MPESAATRRLGIGRLRARFAFAPNQIAVGLAVRAVLAVALPLTVFRLAGLPMAGLFVAIGALQMAISDSGGPYRDRLLAMSLLCALLPEIYLLGTQLGSPWWAATLIMFSLAFLGGLLRALGNMGLPLGMVIGVSYLMGTLTAAPPMAALGQTGWFLAGCLWAVALVLGAWRLRPYLALQRDAGSALAESARLLAAIPAARAEEMTAKALAVRAAIEQARNSLATTRAMAPATNPTLAQLFALLYVPSRLGVLAMSLFDLRAKLMPEREARAALDAAILTLARNTEAATRAVIESRPWTPAEDLQDGIEALAALGIADAGVAAARDVALEALRAGAARLNEAAEVSAFLSRAHGERDVRWLPELALGQRVHELLRSLRAQLSFRSALFRHALRLGTVAGAAMAIEVYWRLPHGMWLVLTVLVVMQPDFGATRARAAARAGGTLAGVLIAGVVLVVVPWPPGRELAIAVLVFLTVLTLRIRYSLAVACLTPLVIILLALYDPTQSWNFVWERVGETLGGVVLSIFGALLLWPDWARRRLPAVFAQALKAGAQYLRASFAAAADSGGLSAAVLDARREAELAVANAEAAFQTMLAEPGRKEGERERHARLNVELGRLVRNLGVLGARLEAGLEPVPDLAPLGKAWTARLDAAAEIMTGGTPASVPIASEPTPDLSGAPPGMKHLVAAVGDAVAELADTARPDWRAGLVRENPAIVPAGVKS
ncbi:MAG: FUSC family protein [Gammaproteobacteria bacterium]